MSFLLIELVILKANDKKLRLEEIFSIKNLKLKSSQFFFLVELMIYKQIWQQLTAVKILLDVLLIMTNYRLKLEIIKDIKILWRVKYFTSDAGTNGLATVTSIFCIYLAFSDFHSSALFSR